MPGIDMDAVVTQTVQQLGAEIALLRLELNAARAGQSAAVSELEEFKAAKEAT